MHNLNAVDLKNANEVINAIGVEFGNYYANMDMYDTNMEALIKLGGIISTLYWFIAIEESRASATIDLKKAQFYLTLKEESPSMTIPELESHVKINTHTYNEECKRLSASLKSMDRFLTQISIRIKNLRKEKLDNINPPDLA